MWIEHRYQAFETIEEARSFARKHGGALCHAKSHDKTNREEWKYLAAYYLDSKFVAAVVWNESHE